METLFNRNSVVRLTKKVQTLSFLLLLAVIFSSCGDGQRQARKVQEEQLKEAKEEAEVSINQIKRDVDERIEYLEGEIEEASGEVEEKLKESRKELKKQSAKLDEELKNIQEATLETWDKARTNASQTIENSRKKTNEISKKVREMLD